MEGALRRMSDKNIQDKPLVGTDVDAGTVGLEHAGNHFEKLGVVGGRSLAGELHPQRPSPLFGARLNDPVFDPLQRRRRRFPAHRIPVSTPGLEWLAQYE